MTVASTVVFYSRDSFCGGKETVMHAESVGGYRKLRSVRIQVATAGATDMHTVKSFSISFAVPAVLLYSFRTLTCYWTVDPIVTI